MEKSAFCAIEVFCVHDIVFSFFLHIRTFYIRGKVCFSISVILMIPKGLIHYTDEYYSTYLNSHQFAVPYQVLEFCSL